jgi:hypothetical protein
MRRGFTDVKDCKALLGYCHIGFCGERKNASAAARRAEYCLRRVNDTLAGGLDRRRYR